MKIKEIKELNLEQLNQKVAELSEELFDLKFKAKVSTLENPMAMKNIRKTIARIKTVINEKKVKA